MRFRKCIDKKLLCGKIIKETIVVDRLFDYLVFLVHRRAVGLGLSEVKMFKNLFDGFRPVNDRNYSHKVRTAGT